MNKDNIQQIFTHYIEKFDYVNDEAHDENYKWYVAKEYRSLMDEALAKSGQDFADALYKVKVCTENIIDSYTQPFYGLCMCAREEPETVRQMFLDLLRDDDTDLPDQEKRIRDFFDRSNELLDQYFPGSFLYKQNSHSVSSYLFLYDPDSHYMYKAEQSKNFADCIEYYDDWGTGDNIKLDVYYRMCDWIVDRIMDSEELLATDASRFELDSDGAMYPDENKHMLAFDLIYCCSVYDLFDGISFTKLNAQEKNLALENRKKAAEALENFNTAKEDKEKLDEAFAVLDRELVPGVLLQHKKYGAGEILSYEKRQLKILFSDTGEEKKFGAVVLIANGIAKPEDTEIAAAFDGIIPWLKRADSIERIYKNAEMELQKYSKYLE